MATFFFQLSLKYEKTNLPLLIFKTITTITNLNIQYKDKKKLNIKKLRGASYYAEIHF